MEDPEGGPQERCVACGLALGRPCAALRLGCQHGVERRVSQKPKPSHSNFTLLKMQPGSGKQSEALNLEDNNVRG